MIVTRKTLITLATLTVMIAIAVNVAAVAPTPEAIEKWKTEGVLQEKLDLWKDFKAHGGSSAEPISVFDKKKARSLAALGLQAADTAYVIVIMVDFDDHRWNDQNFAGTPEHFQTSLFSNRDIDPVYNPTGSMTDFYLENSYGAFYIKGDIYGWYRMPEPYSYYVGTLPDGTSANGIDFRAFTPDSRDLTYDAVEAADADGVDFSKYDNDNDGSCDGVIVIHAGLGAEAGAYGIWSHKATLKSALYPDGVRVLAYTMNPEEAPTELSPIGVFCHEYGHILGLPDLYDTDYEPESSDGLGRWSLMASGNYNGNSHTPAHFDAWCKDQIGFLTLIDVNSNISAASIPAVENSPVAYRLQNGTSGNEHWIVENRQKTGFDASLPSEGLLIYHIDPSQPNNDNVDNYLVALEQADGEFDLEYTVRNTGDAGDPFPGNTNNWDFHDLSLPGSEAYHTSFPTEIGVWDISDSRPVMTADLDIAWSRPYLEFNGPDSITFSDAGGNGDGNLDPTEEILFYFEIINLMRGGFNARATLTTNNPDLTIQNSDVLFASQVASMSPVTNASYPIKIQMADTVTPTIDSFFLTITVDSLPGTPGGPNYTEMFAFELGVGTPSVLIVDDDGGAAYEIEINEVFKRRRMPTNIWSKAVQGSPSGANLMKYPIVFWHTGAGAGDVITQADMDAMAAHMDAGKGLMLSSTSGISGINALDPTFLQQYFQAGYVGDTVGAQNIRGISGSEVGGTLKYKAPPIAPFDTPKHILNAYGAGEAFLKYNITSVPASMHVCGVSYRGSHKAILLGFPIEAIQDDAGILYPPKDTLIARMLTFFGHVSTSVYEGDPFAELPKNFELNQNYPNPFNPTTTISYTISSNRDETGKAQRTTLNIYNLLGQNVRTLVDEVQIPGTYDVEWDGSTTSGGKIASGVYFYRLTLGAVSDTRKMILLK